MLKANDALPKKRTVRHTHPVMIYVDEALMIKWDEFAYEKAKSKSAIAREALQARLNSKENDYTSGFNDGLEAALAAAENIEAFKMRFPSGKTFVDLLTDELAGSYRETEND